MADLRTAFPDLKVEIDGPVVAEGDQVAFRFTMSGTNTGGSFMDLKPSNKAHEWPGMVMVRVADGKIVDEWLLWSGASLYSRSSMLFDRWEAAL